MKKIVYFITLPISYFSASWFKYLRKGYSNIPTSHKKIINKIGVFPVIDHYYDPFYDINKIDKKRYESFRMFDNCEYSKDKQLEQIKYFKEKYFNIFFEDLISVKEQLKELKLNTGNFWGLDAFIYYCLIVEKRPNKIIEVGSGVSTLIALKAIERTNSHFQNYNPEFYCVEPYEMKWLENTAGIKIIRSKLEDCFNQVVNLFEKEMMLFIDSSHIIKPQSDLIHIFTKLLPKLQVGSLVHFHDIYLPFDYPFELLESGNIFSNEQYLLGAYLTDNHTVEIQFSNYYISKDIEFDQEIIMDFIPKSFWFLKK